MAFDLEIKYKDGFSIPDAMNRLYFNQVDDERNLVDYSSPNLDESCIHFAEQKLIPFEELRSECECDEFAKRIIRGSNDGE